MTNSAHPEPSRRAELARFAAQEFLRLQASARAAVASRQVTADKAEARLKAWLAIAALAGSDLPDLVEPLAELRIEQRFPGGQFGQCSEQEARKLLAADLCPNGEWRRELERATDTAMEKAFDAETNARAGQFLALSKALHQNYVSKPPKEKAT